MKRLEAKKSIQMKPSDRSKSGYLFDLKESSQKNRIKLETLKKAVSETIIIP
jgi:hypothetical protein